MTRRPPDITPEVLRHYALLADGERGALVGPHGDIVWLCAPRWDNDAVFSSLLGGAGEYVVTPSVHWYVWGGYYEEGSLIWRSRWVTSDGAVECREALALPSDPHTVVVLRRIEALDREAELDVSLNPRAGFGRHRLRGLAHQNRVWQGRVGDLHVRWTGVPEARPEDGRLRAHLSLRPGEQRDLVLEISDRPLPDSPPDPGLTWDATSHQWSLRVPQLTDTLGPRDARHAYAVMSGLTSCTGGMVAAATAALPERARAGRNYDYRYCWIRDQAYAGRAVAADGPHPLLDSAIEFTSARLLDDGPHLKPAYTTEGGSVPQQHQVDQLLGYPGGGTSLGNRIDKQFQLDMFGEILLLLAAGARWDHLEPRHWKAAEMAVRAIEQRGNDPDAGVWELSPHRWAESRLSCVSGLRAIAAVAPSAQAAGWAQLADRVLADTAQDCLHSSGRWQRAPDDDRVDAALLLAAIRGAVPADDPRSVATLEAVLEELVQDGYVYRFRHDPRPLNESEGAFLLCGFWATLALHQQGRPVEARAFFERTRAACGPAGLYSEEYDVVQRQLRGNLPQAFVHALLLEASARLAGPWTNEHDREESTRT